MGSRPVSSTGQALRGNDGWGVARLFSWERTHLKAVLLAARPKQWTKNLLIYVPLFFTAGDAWDFSDAAAALSLLVKATVAVVLFSLVSSGQYMVNDVLDADEDRRHARKRRRPVASGALAAPVALTLGGVLAAAGIAGAFALEPDFGWVTAIYLATTAAYSFALKRIVLLDVFVISAGFVLRTVAGAAVLDVPVSPWLYTCAGLGALFIALSKRRSELVNAGNRAPEQRETLDLYSRPLLDQLIGISATAALLTYVLYTFTAPNLPDDHSMMLTAPFAVYILFRYIYLVQRRGAGENPEDVFTSDLPIIVAVALWLLTALAVLLRAAG